LVPLNELVGSPARLARAAASLIPGNAGIRLERYLRGMEEYHYLQNADVVIVSFGKSGRTWLRVMLSHYYQKRFHLESGQLIERDNFHLLNAAIPRFLFTHDNYLPDYVGKKGDRSFYSGRRVILLVRHPADTAVSQHAQWRHRMRPRKRLINGYPDPAAGMSLFEFAMSESAGIPKVIRFLNTWASQIDAVEPLLVVRYETLRESTDKTLRSILEFAGESPSAEEVASCVAFASADNLRQLEMSGFFSGASVRMGARQAGNTESLKVRRARAGGYREDFTQGEVEQIDALVSSTLSPIFGYGRESPSPGVL
jgi:hypothetical protein